MKKILAFVLALAMVLGMATMVSAADPKIEVKSWDDDEVVLKLTADEAFSTIEITDNAYGADSIDFGKIPATGLVTYNKLGEDATKIFVVIYDEDGEQVLTETFVKTVKANAKLDREIVKAMINAVTTNSDTVVINLANVYNHTVTATDWGWMLHGVVNSMKGDVEFDIVDEDNEVVDTMDLGWWNEYDIVKSAYGYNFLNMNFRLVLGTTTFYIDAADIDYTWDEDICFDIDDGLAYDGYTKAEIFAAIRKLSGDTKNPYTFGFEKPSKVPTMTVSYVIPQQWINVYGHKNLALWAYSSVEEKCEACGAKHEEFKVLSTTTLDAVTQTQRITFETNEFFRTLVLSKTAASTAADNTNKTDANPNTGANDIVNVAIVFSVISLVAAGAFVFSKQR